MISDWDLSSPKPNKILDKSLNLLSKNLLDKNIALLVSGSIAAYQTPDLVRLLRKNGAKVQVFCSESALNFVTEQALSWVSDNKVYTGLSYQVEHLGEDEFDLYLLAPATYNTINKFANGIADSILTTTLSSALGYLHLGKAKIMICPTLHYSMHNEILVESLLKLRSYGVMINEPRQEDGKNKLPKIETIIDSIKKLLNG